MNDKTIIGMRFSSGTPDGFLIADAKLHRLGEQRPYFSVTGELWQSEGWYRNGQDARLHECGQLHERILKAFPNLAPVVALHLADEDGVPMHAEANGWYWYSDAYDGALEKAARAIRIDPSELPEGMDRDQFHAFIEALRPRWKREADEARAYLESVQA